MALDINMVVTAFLPLQPARRARRHVTAARKCESYGNPGSPYASPTHRALKTFGHQGNEQTHIYPQVMSNAV